MGPTSLGPDAEGGPPSSPYCAKVRKPWPGGEKALPQVHSEGKRQNRTGLQRPVIPSRTEGQTDTWAKRAFQVLSPPQSASCLDARSGTSLSPYWGCGAPLVRVPGQGRGGGLSVQNGVGGGEEPVRSPDVCVSGTVCAPGASSAFPVLKPKEGTDPTRAPWGQGGWQIGVGHWSRTRCLLASLHSTLTGRRHSHAQTHIP